MRVGAGVCGIGSMVVGGCTPCSEAIDGNLVSPMSDESGVICTGLGVVGSTRTVGGVGRFNGTAVPRPWILETCILGCTTNCRLGCAPIFGV